MGVWLAVDELSDVTAERKGKTFLKMSEHIGIIIIAMGKKWVLHFFLLLNLVSRE